MSCTLGHAALLARRARPAHASPSRPQLHPQSLPVCRRMNWPSLGCGSARRRWRRWALWGDLGCWLAWLLAFIHAHGACAVPECAVPEHARPHSVCHWKVAFKASK